MSEALTSNGFNSATRTQAGAALDGAVLGSEDAAWKIGQILALGTEHLLGRGELIELFPDWSDERFPLYAFHLSRHVPPAKVRAFLDFVVGSVR